MWTRGRMSVEAASRRLKQIQNVLRHGIRPTDGNGSTRLQIRLNSSSSKGDSKTVTIGDVGIKVRHPNYPELVPSKYLPKEVPQAILRHLRWIMQKDLLGQDVFLIGPPGPFRRQVAMMYLELTGREAEYVSLSRDTTESDLKQRREITGGTAFYIDQCAVRAALKGRVLVLEGIEKAERNVLPVLNNLLENREMQLDDGRFLVAADRYDKLLQEHTKEELDSLHLVRVDENFRVIALGLPIPRYQGNPLDPPLRSRFQARDVHPLPFKELLESLQENIQKLPSERVSQLLSFASTMLTNESTSMGLPDFPLDNLKHVVQVMDNVPGVSSYEMLHRIYPYSVMLGADGKTAVEDTLNKFELVDPGRGNDCSLNGVQRQEESALVDFQHNRKQYQLTVPAGKIESMGESEFVQTPYHDALLTQMLQSHSVHDFCVIGPRGCGKSAVVSRFADLLGYHIEPIMLYQDMTSRDLLQQRTTLPNGDTIWRPSPLATAAMDGSLAVLDGVHRINPGSFAVLHRLIHERELQLFDGSRLLGKDKYEAVKSDNSYNDEDMAERMIFPIHPSFRMVALSEPPVVGSSKQQWLTPELLTMFLFHNMRPLSRTEEMDVITRLVPGTPDLSKLFDLVHKLRDSSDGTLQSLASSLSTRQLLRIARVLSLYPSNDLYNIVHKACLARFLPRLARSALDQCLESVGILPDNVDTTSVVDVNRALTCESRNGKLRIGETEVNVYTPNNITKVPDILFYENPQHLSVMEDMLKDFTLGEHLLLVGNQGVGKNKIIDRFLQLLNRPREYIQLHRDTTVQTLTLQPTVRDGVIIYEDSPLVKAVKQGHVLVVDEADKAPTHVTCVLKTLVESGEMHLADGRRIVSAKSGMKPSESVIVTHPEFRMMVLANRPGFPFLGNDFFGAMGDIFSCHAIDNPDVESEMSMLQQYGPNVPESILRKLVLAFGELRDQADQGLIAYPYSTREVVNMVKHLQKFPNEGLTTVVQNVFDFDSYNKEVRESIIETMQKHGIPLGAKEASVSLAKEFHLPDFERKGQWKLPSSGLRQKTAYMSLPVDTHRISVKGPVQLYLETKNLDRTEARATQFTEQEAYWSIPMEDINMICDVVVSKAGLRSPGRNKTDVIYAASANPITLYSMNLKSGLLNSLDLYDVFPSQVGAYKPHVKLASLSAPLDDSIILHEEVTNVVLSVNMEIGQITRLLCSGLPETPVEKRRFPTSSPKPTNMFKMCARPNTDSYGTIAFYKQDGSAIEILNVLEGMTHTISMPINIAAMLAVSDNQWLLTESNTSRKYLLDRNGIEEFTLRPITEESDEDVLKFSLMSTVPLSDNLLSKTLGEQISSPNRVYSSPYAYASVLVGFPDLTSCDVYTSGRSPLPENKTTVKDPFYKILAKPPAPDPRSGVAYLPESGQIIQALPTWKVPKHALPDGDVNKTKDFSGYLEVCDLANHKIRYVPIPGAVRVSPYASWLFDMSDVNVFMAPMTNDGLVTVDIGGCVRLWETSVTHLERSLNEWRNMIGHEDTRPLQLNVERESGRDHENIEPKHGKEDPMNQPHVGGGQWAGGVGGSGTAGLGGFGGPYRLDAGHEVYQVPQWEKDAVPESVKQAAREMAQKAFKDRLKEIEMSEFDAETYEKFSSSVRRQVQSLKVILDSLQAKGKERQWLKNQSYGDLDDARLIEGLTGEKSIYKRRGEKEPEMGSPQELPKRLRFVVDVSGSMYRFNGHDGRLEREMEAALMVMEALENYDEKIKYEIWGHSGEDHKVPFVKADKPPKNERERLVVLKMMHAHSQFCLSGDNTLEATKHAVQSVVKEEADEHFVIVLSDANFDRYGIRPSRFAEILTEDENVNAYAIFIGSLGDQAIRLSKQLPMGHSFVCMDTKNLPQILQQIFTSTMLSS